jgi:hypothetical protein
MSETPFFTIAPITDSARQLSLLMRQDVITSHKKTDVVMRAIIKDAQKTAPAAEVRKNKLSGNLFLLVLPTSLIEPFIANAIDPITNMLDPMRQGITRALPVIASPVQTNAPKLKKKDSANRKNGIPCFRYALRSKRNGW